LEGIASDPGAKYDKVLIFRAEEVVPQVTLGNESRAGGAGFGKDPNPGELASDNERKSAASAWSTWT